MIIFVCKECLGNHDFEHLTISAICNQNCDVCGKLVNVRTEEYFYLRNSAFERLKSKEKSQSHHSTKQGRLEAYTQITAFVEWVASLSKTEYAAHQQLVAVIEKAQKIIGKT